MAAVTPYCYFTGQEGNVAIRMKMGCCCVPAYGYYGSLPLEIEEILTENLQTDNIGGYKKLIASANRATVCPNNARLYFFVTTR